MHIDSLEIYRVAMPLIYPFRTAFGDDACIESVLVRMCAGGKEGWGESAPWQLPAYSPEWAAGVYLLLREVFGPRIVGREIGSGQELQALLAGVRGNQFAKAALDTAWWDLYAHSVGQPLWQVLGGESPEVAVGEDFGVMESIDALLAAIDTAVKAGFTRVKLKYRPGWELDMLDAVRRAFPSMVFHIDCNSAYRLDDLPMFKKLDRYGLAMIEQPLAYDDLYDHARLQAQIETPVCLDESINSAENTRKALALGACRWVNIKPGRVGGLTPALAIHNLCAEAGVPCWIGGMLESAIGASHCLALATLPNIKYPSDIFATSRFYHRDLAVPPITLSASSRVTAQSGPGIGVIPDPEMLARLTVEQAILKGAV